MKTISPFLCPCCGLKSQQRIVFIGSDFQYQCVQCKTYHVFVENIFKDIGTLEKIDRQGERRTLNRYLGSYDSEKKNFILKDRTLLRHYGVKNTVNLFIRLIDAFEAEAKEGIKRWVHRKVLRPHPQTPNRGFLSAMTYHHFQDYFRAFVNFKHHVLNFDGDNTYNVLVTANLDSANFLWQESHHLEGLHEIWSINEDVRRLAWYLLKTDNDFCRSAQISQQVTGLLDEFGLSSYAVSKRPQATPQGKTLLRDALEPRKVLKLVATSGEPLSGKYLGILVRKDTLERAGLMKNRQIKRILKSSLQFGLRPMITIVDPEDLELVQACEGPKVFLANLQSQAFFYKNHCLGVVGTNSSGCNIPSIYDLPMFIMAKGRRFPDDFYCFGRLASEYRPGCNLLDAELEKPRFVTEVGIPSFLPTSVIWSHFRFIEFLKKLVDLQPQVEHGP